MASRRMRSMAVVAAVLASAVVGGGAAAQAPSSTTCTSVVETTITEPDTTTTEPPLISPAPPNLVVQLGVDCPVSGGASPAPVSSIVLSITNRGGPVVVDIQIDGVVVARSVEVPNSFLDIPQNVRVDLPPGEPDEAIDVELLVAGTDRHLAGAGIDHRPVCEGPPIGQVPAPARPATPRSARPAFTG